MSAMTQSTDKISTRAFFAWFSVALFFFYQYILRVAPGVMVSELRAEFSMTAEQFAMLGAYYLYAYSLVQIPLGLLVDRIGVRKTVTAGILLCTGGGLMLATAEHLWVANVSRVLVGLGSSAAFMCGVKLAADQFSPGKRGLFMGATLSIGLIGALTAGRPLVTVLDQIGWRNTLLVAIALGLVVLALVQIFVPKHKRAQGTKLPAVTTSGIFHDIMTIVKNSKIMIYGVLAIGVYTPISVLADLWGTSFLMQKFALDRGDAAQTSTMMYLGMALGCMILPWFCEKYQMLNRGIQICTLGMFSCFALILYGPAFDQLQLSILLATLGFFCGAEMMCFAGAVRHSTPKNSGITIGVVNTFNMMGGAILQQLIGVILDKLWAGEMTENGLRTYGTDAFVTAMTSLLIVVGVCLVLSLTLNKSKFSEKAALPGSA